MKALFFSIGLLIAFYSNGVSAQNPWSCATAPNPSFQMICMQLQSWDQSARQLISRQAQIDANTVVNAPGVPQQPWLSPAVPQSFNPSQFTCMDLGCLCSYMRGLTGPGGQCVLPGGGALTKAYRKEYRQLTENERQRFHSVLQRMKQSGEYDRLSDQHRQVGTSSGAHSGPGFLPWHREYLKRLEIAIRMIDPGLSLPYWDSILDFYLPDPRDSIIWTSWFLGGQDSAGRVVSGPFAGWRTIEGNPYITRHLGSEGRLFNETDLRNVFAQTEIQNVLAYTAPQTGCPYPPNYGALEYSHASVHLWVGGDMKPPSTSANDPTFFLHHSFVDLIWEQWRQMRQSRWTREQAYSQDFVNCANQQHFANANMRPFEVTNRAGLSNAYTDNMYMYAPRPQCTHQNPNGCSSPYLFCDTRTIYPHCVSKVKMGGLCRGFEGLDICFNGVCVNSRCVPGTFGGASATSPRPPTTLRAAITRAPTTPRTTVAQRQQRRRVVSRLRNPVRTTSRKPINIIRRLTMGAPKTATSIANLRRAPQRFANQTVSTQNCFNDDPCCSIWASRNECRMNTVYMSRYCKRSCGYCRSRQPNRTGCFDRHSSCPYFRSQGECSRRRQWMSENCRASCGWCNMSLSQLCVKDELVFLQAVWRHGDRSPTKTFKTDPYKEDSWPQGFGQLSAKGMEQMAYLARNRLKVRYMDKLKFLSKTYNSKEIYIRSTDVNRTIASAMSHNFGLFSENSRKGIDFPDCDSCWSPGFIPIAVHTIPDHTDYTLNPDSDCPRQDDLMDLVFDGPQYKALFENKREFFKYLSENAGQEIEPSNIDTLYDALYIEKLYNRTWPAWVKDKEWDGRPVFDIINETNCIVEQWTNGINLDPYKGVDFTAEIPKIRGGTLLWSMIGHLEMKKRCLLNPEKHHCRYMSHLKYYGYSAHDTTIAALFSTLGFRKTNFNEDGYPRYTSCVTVEFWRRKGVDANKFYVKFIYWPLDEVEEDVTDEITGCKDSCPLEKLIERSLPHKASPNPKAWCNTPLFDSMGRVQQPKEVQNPENEKNKKDENQGFWRGVGSNIKYIFFDSWVSDFPYC
ncbi:hypothetical protein FO519_009122 [Halicephalobus sp. NKZ332]|nr:hypothetical protein FO519_009122 [Halicephalobus sp. NKZ332]